MSVMTATYAIRQLDPDALVVSDAARRISEAHNITVAEAMEIIRDDIIARKRQPKWMRRK